MLNAQEKAFNTIIDNNGTHDDFMIHLFNSLLSSKNRIFCDYIQGFKNRWEEDDDEITSALLIGKAKSKYANLKKSNDWGRDSLSLSGRASVALLYKTRPCLSAGLKSILKGSVTNWLLEAGV